MHPAQPPIALKPEAGTGEKDVTPWVRMAFTKTILQLQDLTSLVTLGTHQMAAPPTEPPGGQQ